MVVPQQPLAERGQMDFTHSLWSHPTQSPCFHRVASQTPPHLRVPLSSISHLFSFLLHSHHHSLPPSLPPPHTLMTISPDKILSAQLISDVSGCIRRSLLSSSEAHSSLSTFESECREADEDEMMLIMCFCY